MQRLKYARSLSACFLVGGAVVGGGAGFGALVFDAGEVCGAAVGVEGGGVAG